MTQIVSDKIDSCRIDTYHNTRGLLDEFRHLEWCIFLNLGFYNMWPLRDMLEKNNVVFE